MIAALAFRRFKALRQTQLQLQPFNLLIGPNGSGKTSVIQALLRLALLAKLPLRTDAGAEGQLAEGPEVTFTFNPPHEDLRAIMSCVSDIHCDLLQVVPPPSGDTAGGWAALRERLIGMRGYAFDHRAMMSSASPSAELSANGDNLAGVLAMLKEEHPDAFARLLVEFIRLHPEYDDLKITAEGSGKWALTFRLAGASHTISVEDVSQGTLYLLGMLAIAFHPAPPTLVCIEEVDRGVHPRLLREVRDTLYRLSHPGAFGETRTPVQVVATTHSPYLLDLFSHHPEEVVISVKQGTVAHFSRLSDREDLPELLEEGTLGDIWYSGVLGGVPSQE